MLQVNVSLPNGHAEFLSLLPSSTVQDLKQATQRAFGQKFLRLITAKNRVLVDPDKTLEEAQIEDGECLTAVVLQPQLAATNNAFALWCHGDSAIVTWGHADRGGDSSSVQDQLRGVQQTQATVHAFAAILADGSVVTWVMQRLAVTVRQFEISSVVCSRFRPQIQHLLRFWQTNPSLPGVTQTKAVTVQKWEISSEVCGRFRLQRGAPPPASCTSTCSAPPGPCADKSTGCEGEENLQGILWPPASRRARRPRALC